jgi:protocatechuate 3,4-dioxygenase beta subunit
MCRSVFVSRSSSPKGRCRSRADRRDTGAMSDADGFLDRRTALRLLGGVGLGALVTACGSSSSRMSVRPSRTTNAGPATPSTAITSTGQTACVLAPEMTDGPFYLDLKNLRSDIVDGRPGAPLALALTVSHASTCAPISGASVDIWHADAGGVYSGFGNGSGRTFLRGTQLTGTDGTTRFQTIYPGWYSGRAVHIHVKVHTGGQVVHTGQLFFEDALTSSVFQLDPYSSRGAPDTRNANDSIYRDGGAQSTLSPSVSGAGYAATMTLGMR